MFITDVADLIGRIDRAFVAACTTGMMFGDDRKRKSAAWHVMDASPETWPASVTRLKGLLPVLRRTAVFRFENLPLNAGEENYVLPRLDAQGLEVFNAGAAELPFDACWLEYPIPLGRAAALLVERRGADYLVREFIRYPSGGLDGGLLLKSTCLDLVCRPASAGVEDFGLYRGLHWKLESPTGSLPQFIASLTAGSGRTADEAIRGCIGDMLFFAYMLLVMKSNARRIVRLEPSAFANRRRRDKDLMPLPVEHVVTLDADWAPGEAGPLWLDTSKPLPEFPAEEFL